MIDRNSKCISYSENLDYKLMEEEMGYFKAKEPFLFK